VALSCRFDAVAADAADLGRTNAPLIVVRVAITATVNNTRQRFAVPGIPPCTVAD
jgi:hypothetical protein